MYELRFILLGLGVVTILGVWWWEQRRSRATRDYRDARPADRQEPRLDDDDDGAGISGDLPFADDEVEPLIAARHPAENRIDPGVPPPLVTIDDLPDDVDEVELADYADPADRPLLHRYDDEPPRPAPVHAPEPPVAEVRRRPEPAPAPPRTTDAAQPAPPPSQPAPPAPDAPRAATSRPVSRAPRGSTAEAAVDTPPEQRIVAIRMAAGATPVSGRALLASLQAEGLEFGRYAIFHRQREDGRMLFSVASLLEPGSFDLEVLPTQTLPGVSLFAVFPGPVDAAQVFDDMLATARRLADRLGGSLQDERGQSLSAQRILALREELVHFQTMVAKIRARTAG